ncbi:hypothetical protein BOW86_gp084 [Synechococcus phage S-CAM7]|uniref:Uncharacterized protein n=1 Tax=Synechococcus phage S-CAM7 TaxID=1883368 RepID=A0A1D8KTJ5_9CAUD|nr:hypothetical protein BOW86_gp084 [Synechococcus phage S-CAM7]AOV62008.1 hypothetical protein C490910_084 [Synechococcus phage S-CAM7]
MLPTVKPNALIIISIEPHITFPTLIPFDRSTNAFTSIIFTHSSHSITDRVEDRSNVTFFVYAVYLTFVTTNLFIYPPFVSIGSTISSNSIFNFSYLTISKLSSSFPSVMSLKLARFSTT